MRRKQIRFDSLSLYICLYNHHSHPSLELNPQDGICTLLFSKLAIRKT
jgi:hypothetical protein